MPKKPVSFAQYSAAYPPSHRMMLSKLRTIILAAAPKATECMSYALPAFRLEGRPLVAIGAARAHCSLYPMSGRTIAALADDLTSLSTSKGTIRFELDQPLPAGLIRRIVRMRITENAAKAAGTRAQRTCQPCSPPLSLPARRASRSGGDTASVTKFLAGLDHPHLAAVRAARAAILGAAPDICEEIKWNAPSFRRTRFFATIHLRARGSIQVIFHTGAKPAGKARGTFKLAAPDASACSLRWPDKDRCVVTLPLNARGTLSTKSREALGSITRAWVRQL